MNTAEGGTFWGARSLFRRFGHEFVCVFFEHSAHSIFSYTIDILHSVPHPRVRPSPNFSEIKRGPVPRVTVKPRSWKHLEPHGAYRVMACGAFERPVVSIGWPRLLYGRGRDVQGIVPMETSSV